MYRARHHAAANRGIAASAVGVLMALALTTACAPHRGAEVTPRAKTARPIDRGMASWYGRKFQGRMTASGERYDMQALTAAHRTLSFGTRVRVVNVENGRSVVVRINDRGPWVRGRVIDLSYAAAERLDMIRAGLVRVELYLVE